MALLLAGLCSAQTEPLAAQNETQRISVGLLWWPSNPHEDLHAFVHSIEHCLTKKIRQSPSVSSVVASTAVRDMLYPLMEPGTQPPSEEAFAQLLQRRDVRTRLHDSGLHYLVAFTGGTQGEEFVNRLICGGGMGAAGCFGYVWWDESTQLDAVLWNLGIDGEPEHAQAHDEGTSLVLGWVLPVPILARTKIDACNELGATVTRVIEQRLSSRRQ
jgi:hypothetical protein